MPGPIDDDPPAVTEPIDSMINKYARKINILADSLFP